MGILTPYHYFGCFDDVNYEDLPIGAYSVRDLERKLIIRERHEAIIRKGTSKNCFWEEQHESDSMTTASVARDRGEPCGRQVFST
jgi:hypothetical protein